MSGRPEVKPSAQIAEFSVIEAHLSRGCSRNAWQIEGGNFLRTLATPEPIKDWSLTSLKEKLIKVVELAGPHAPFKIPVSGRR